MRVGTNRLQGHTCLVLSYCHPVPSVQSIRKALQSAAKAPQALGTEPQLVHTAQTLLNSAFLHVSSYTFDPSSYFKMPSECTSPVQRLPGMDSGQGVCCAL